MDLDTFITRLYVWIDDWYKAELAAQIVRRHGPEPKMSDSEVLTVAIAGQWRRGVPWDSERGVVRYMQTSGRQWFPNMLKRSRYNERVRNLCTVFMQLQQALAKQLGHAQDCYEVVDCLPLPSCSNAQAKKQGHWLWWGTWGHGGTGGGIYWGDQAIVSVTQAYAITGWLIGPAHTDDRTLLQVLLSQRQGHAAFLTPTPWRPWRQLAAPSFVGPLSAAGSAPLAATYLGDKGFNGYRWQTHWYTHYAVSVLTPPKRDTRVKAWPRSWRRWFASCRQRVETIFAVLSQVFAVKQLRAHSRWGQWTRFALATAAFNWGLWLNRFMRRPDLSHETLIDYV